MACRKSFQQILQNLLRGVLNAMFLDETADAFDAVAEGDNRSL